MTQKKNIIPRGKFRLVENGLPDCGPDESTINFNYLLIILASSKLYLEIYQTSFIHSFLLPYLDP